MLQPSRLILLGVLCLPWAAFALQETWESGYARDDASGKHVLG